MKFLLALPFIGLLWVPFYNQETPTLFGFPFFYWYQFLWVPITSLLIWIVFKNLCEFRLVLGAVSVDRKTLLPLADVEAAVDCRLLFGQLRRHAGQKCAHSLVAPLPAAHLVDGSLGDLRVGLP